MATSMNLLADDILHQFLALFFHVLVERPAQRSLELLLNLQKQCLYEQCRATNTQEPYLFPRQRL
jgi:hypothetical protein